uniref:Uncharacterized protein n=1 Tax=Anopheles farauti TaxID=69004 RepID=A0A182QYX2_9DIPT
MRLNDPQIELVHDDPFMGYINEDSAACVEEPTTMPTEEEEEEEEEELDVGENSRSEASFSVRKVASSGRRGKHQPVAGSEEQAGSSITTTTAHDSRQPYVIVLLME